jgi:hypothetical protein
VERHPLLAQVTRLLVCAVLAAGTLAGCQDAPDIHLAARLTSPTDVVLQWSGTDPAAAGLAVEYATEQAGPYTNLAFLPARRTTFTHPDLMPETTFFYRVRPFYGPASPAVEVTLPPGEYDETAHRDDPDWAAPRTVADQTVTAKSIRDPKTVGVAAPGDLRAKVADPNGIAFTWRDRASDEEGYLVEARPAGSTEFSPVAVLDPQVNSFGLVTLPTEKRASYRVRAFYYGQPSNVASRTT